MRNPIVVTLLGFTALLSGTASSHHSVTAQDVITVVAVPNRQPGFRFVNSSNFTDGKGAQYSRGTATRNRNATAEAVATQQGLERMAGRWKAPGAVGRP